MKLLDKVANVAFVLTLAGFCAAGVLASGDRPNEQRPSQIIEAETSEERAERVRQAVSDHKWIQDMTQECLAGNVGFSRVPSENWC